MLSFIIGCFKSEVTQVLPIIHKNTAQLLDFKRPQTQKCWELLCKHEDLLTQYIFFNEINIYKKAAWLSLT